MPAARAQGIPPGITHVTTAQNWVQTSTTALTGCPTGISCATQALTLSSCPPGLDVSGQGMYDVYISDGSNSEAVLVTGGSTASCPSSATITFVPYFSHSRYSIGSASSGIQETINLACGATTASYYNGQCDITVPANGGPSTPVYVHPLNSYNVYGTIFFHANQSVLSGYGVSLSCYTRGPCLQVGDLLISGHYLDSIIEGFHFRTPAAFKGQNAYLGNPISNTVRTSGKPSINTITTGSAHGFRPGDMVTIQFTDTNSYWGDAIVSTVPSATTFTYQKIGVTNALPSQNTPGLVALAYDAILDDGENSYFIDIGYDEAEFWNFNNFFDIWDDENAVIDHFGADGTAAVRASANWTGSFIFAACNQGSHAIAPVITLRDSTITAGYASGITDYCSNGLYIENTVLQATGPWQVNSSNSDGNYQGVYLKNIYSESGLSSNPASPVYSPWPGLGVAGLILGGSGGVSQIEGGSGGLSGAFPTGGSGSKPYSYYIVANDWTGTSCGLGTHTQTSPMQILDWKSTGSDSIPVRWPRIANGMHSICYDVLRMSTSLVVNGAFGPYYGGCPGGSGGTCGSVAIGISQATACSGTLICTYTDNGSSTTSPYTVNQGTYSGLITFWPGALVTVNSSVQVDREQSPVVGIGLQSNPAQIAKSCSDYGVAGPGAYTSCLASTNAIFNQTATVLGDGGPHAGPGTGMTGRLNFSTSPYGNGIGHGQIITLVDSNPALTLATGTYRRPANARDTWIGLDSQSTLNAATLAFGSPVAISNYIANTGSSGSGWLERLTASLKEFNVPAKFDQSISVAHLIISAESPKIASGFGTNAAVVHNNGTAVFTINVGRGGTASSGVVGLPAAANGWAVHCDDVTTQSTSVFITKQTAGSTTSATITQYSSAAVPTAWAAGDTLMCQAAAY